MRETDAELGLVGLNVWSNAKIVIDRYRAHTYVFTIDHGRLVDRPPPLRWEGEAADIGAPIWARTD